jgi:hypothetical protein
MTPCAVGVSLAILLLTVACRPSPVEQTLGELARKVSSLPGCGDARNEVLTVSATAALAHTRAPGTFEARRSVRGFLLPHADGCTEMGCDEADPCCNGCSIGWSLADAPIRQPPIFYLFLRPGTLRADTGVSECEAEGLWNSNPTWEVVVTGRFEEPFPGASGSIEVDRLCVVAVAKGDHHPLPNWALHLTNGSLAKARSHVRR